MTPITGWQPLCFQPTPTTHCEPPGDIKASTTYGEGSIATPFGDYKQSGFGVGGKTFMSMTTSPKNTKDARHAVWG